MASDRGKEIVNSASTEFDETRNFRSWIDLKNVNTLCAESRFVETSWMSLDLGCSKKAYVRDDFVKAFWKSSKARQVREIVGRSHWPAIWRRTSSFSISVLLCSIHFARSRLASCRFIFSGFFGALSLDFKMLAAHE